MLEKLQAKNILLVSLFCCSIIKEYNHYTGNHVYSVKAGIHIIPAVVITENGL